MTWVGAVSPSLFGYISKLRRNRKEKKRVEQEKKKGETERVNTERKGGAEKGGRRGRKTEKRGIRGEFKNKEKRGGG
jgi:hypothetical protein